MSKNITIEIPVQIRHLNGDKPEFEILPQPTPHTLKDALAQLPQEIQPRIFSDDGNLRRTLLCYVNDEQPENLDIEINPGDRITLLAASAGG